MNTRQSSQQDTRPSSRTPTFRNKTEVKKKSKKILFRMSNAVLSKAWLKPKCGHVQGIHATRAHNIKH